MHSIHLRWKIRNTIPAQMKNKKLQPCQESHFKYLNKKKQFSHLFKINFHTLNESKVKILTFTSQLHFTTNIFAFTVL